MRKNSLNYQCVIGISIQGKPIAIYKHDQLYRDIDKVIKTYTQIKPQ